METISDRQRSVFLVDDHPIVRRGLEQLIDRQEDLCAVGQAGSGREALQTIGNATPDIALVDIAMEDMDGIELTRRLKARMPKLIVLIVSTYGDNSYIAKARAAGADGYLTKDQANDSLVRVISEVLGAEKFIIHR